MPPDDLPVEALKKQNEGLQLRNDLRREALTRLNDVVHGVDTRAYEHASIAVGAFVARTMDAADVLHTELLRDETLPAGNADKLPQNIRRFYEDFVTEAESIAIILPALMQQARLTQHAPTMQARFTQLFDMISIRDGFLDQIELSRAALLKAQGSRIQGRPIRFDDQQLARIIAIADQGWRIRQQLVVPINLQELIKQLGADEANTKVLTQRLGSAARSTTATADQLRRNLGAARVTQGMPAAEVILDNPNQSIQTWRRLIVQGGPNERRRYARQLREAVGQFRQDFVDMRLYEEFEKYARQRMEKYIKANEPGMADRMAEWCGTLGLEHLAARVRNNPKSFRDIFEQVTKEMRAQFESIRKRDNGGLEQFGKLLEGLEKGGALDQKAFEERITAYADVQEHAIGTLSAVQRWMVAENVGVMGNPAQGRANMLEQVTRVGDQTLVGFLRDQSPYGMFRQQSYVDPRTNRLVLVTPVQGPNGFLEHATYHGLNAGRAVVYSAGTALLIYLLMTKLPYLSTVGPLHQIVVPVVLAELSLAGADNLARQEQARVAVENITKIVTLLQGPPTLNDRDAATAANAMFTSLVVLLHVANADASPHMFDRISAIEAHIYTNQLMVALGYPPHHRLGPTVIPASINDVPANRRSPELMQFLTVHYSDIESDRKRTQEQREEKNKLHVRVQEALKKLGVQVEVQQQSGVTRILRGEIPDALRLDDLLAAARALPEPQRKKIFATFGPEGSAEQQLAVFQLVGGFFLTMKRLRKIHDTYKNDTLGLPQNQQDPAVRRQIILKRNRTYSLDGVNFTYAQVEQDIRRYIFQTPLPHLLAASEFLQAAANQPNDDQLSQHWHGTALPWVRTFAVDYLNTRHGVVGQRGGLGIEVLRDFEQAVEYARAHLRDGEAEMRRKNLAANPVPAAPAEGALAADQRIFADAFLARLLTPEVLKQEQALNGEIIEIHKVAAALSQERDTVQKDPLRVGWAYDTYTGNLGRYNINLASLQKSFAAHGKPIEELRALTREAVVSADTQVQLQSVQHDDLAGAFYPSVQPPPVVFTRGMRSDAEGRREVFDGWDRLVLGEMALLPFSCRENSEFALSNFVGVEFVRNQQGQQELYVATFVYRRGTQERDGFRYIQQVFVRNLETDGTPASFISHRGMPIITNELSHLPVERRGILGQRAFKSFEARRGQEISKKIGRAGRLYCLACGLPPGQAGVLETDAQGRATTLTIRSANSLTLLFIAADGSMTHATGQIAQEDQKQMVTKEWAERAYKAITAPQAGPLIFDLTDGEMKTAQQLDKAAFASPRNTDTSSITALLQATQSPISAQQYIDRIAAAVPGVDVGMRVELQDQLRRLFRPVLQNNTLFNQQACQALVQRVMTVERTPRNIPALLGDAGEVSQAVYQIEQAMRGQ